MARDFAQAGHFSPELREERRKAYAAIKEKRDAKKSSKHVALMAKVDAPKGKDIKR